MIYSLSKKMHPPIYAGLPMCKGNWLRSAIKWECDKAGCVKLDSFREWILTSLHRTWALPPLHLLTECDAVIRK
jgi:hypothetical protein